jgi:hypothetical protein
LEWRLPQDIICPGGDQPQQREDDDLPLVPEKHEIDVRHTNAGRRRLDISGIIHLQSILNTFNTLNSNKSLQ